MSTDKQILRAQIWSALRAAKAHRFPGVEGRIPNFVGAEVAARRLAALPVFQSARTLKCNPDSPQRPVRHAALRAGKVLVIPAPRLAVEHPFLILDPAEIEPGLYWSASSIKGAFQIGRPATAAQVGRLDLIVTGCVGAGRDGARLGKGGGYSDLEYAMLRELGLVDADTPIVSTVHPVQLKAAGALPMKRHDISLDWIVTPEEAIACERVFSRPAGVIWEALDEEKIAAIPVLQAWRAKGRKVAP